MPSLEDVYTKVNQCRVPRFQFLVMLILSSATISLGGLPLLLTLLSVTQTKRAKYWSCAGEAECNQSRGLCEQSLTANDWVSTLGPAPESFVKDFNIWCNSTTIIQTVSSLFFIGFMCGTTLGGLLCDAIGRKKSGIASLLLCCVSTVLHMFSSHDFRVFSAAHIVSGFCSGAGSAIMFTYQCEMVISRYRNVSAQIFAATFTIGTLYGTMLSAYVSSWHWICILLPIPTVLFSIIVILWVPESPFWLHSKGETEKVFQILSKIARINRVKYTRDERIEQSSSHHVHERPESLLTVFQTWDTARTALILLFCWLTTSFCYWGLSFNVGSLYGNIFQNQLIICALDFINRPLNWLLLVYMKRKPFFMCCNGAMCVSAVLCMLPYPQELFPGFNLRKISALLGRMVADQYFSTIYLYTIEVYPTPFRTAGLGLSSSAARIGSFVAPFVIVANTYSDDIIFALILALTFIGLVVFGWMPETKDRNLPENIYDMKKLIGGRSGREEALFELLQYDEEEEEEEIFSRA